MPRSKGFNPETTLEMAVTLFWEHGYEGTSLADLLDHMGLSRRSLYDTYGDKHALYLRCLQRYQDHVNDWLDQSQDETATTQEQLRRWLMAALPHPGRPTGSFIVNAMAELGQRDSEVSTVVQQALADYHQRVGQLLTRGQQFHEVAHSVDVDLLATSFVTFYLGLTVMVRQPVVLASLPPLVDAQLAILG